ncbi:MAG: cobyrinate a,c-diamide synthase [Lachnospiraceae bacterium]|nr:cobyrinate a,c-diamide synthase [Lachnospiraceae bacterium]
MDEHRVNRIMIAAPKSGSGKTTVTCALLEALKNRGLAPVSFKCGPDYIDPLFHKKVLGVEGRNLDIFFSGEAGVRKAVSACSRYAVAEGVMGIYDGMRAASVHGSCYEIASVTDTPIVLTVDASGIGRTVISIIKGILADDTNRLIKGIILNRISEGFYNDLKSVLEQELAGIGGDIRLLGFFPQNCDVTVSSRHLGLMLPGEIEDLHGRITAAAELLEKNVDMDGLLNIMESATTITDVSGDDACPAEDTGLTLAVAYDEAFCFYYRDNLDAFEKRGVKIKFFSPLKDARLPEGTCGILLGGGYPEDHLEELSKNCAMKESIQNAIEQGIPSLAECGGFMYLHRAITGMDGISHEMAGVIDGYCEFTGHLIRFGYMEVVCANNKKRTDVLAESLAGMRGHEFHYYESTACGKDLTAKKPGRDKRWECVIIRNNGIWGFPHFYYESQPEFVNLFIKKMKEAKDG